MPGGSWPAVRMVNLVKRGRLRTGDLQGTPTTPPAAAGRSGIQGAVAANAAGSLPAASSARRGRGHRGASTPGCRAHATPWAALTCDGRTRPVNAAAWSPARTVAASWPSRRRRRRLGRRCVRGRRDSRCLLRLRRPRRRGETRRTRMGESNPRPMHYECVAREHTRSTSTQSTPDSARSAQRTRSSGFPEIFHGVPRGDAWTAGEPARSWRCGLKRDPDRRHARSGRRMATPAAAGAAGPSSGQRDSPAVPRPGLSKTRPRRAGGGMAE